VASTEGAYGEAAESVQVGIAQTRDDLIVELHPATPVTGTVRIAGATPAPAEDCSVSLARRDGRRYEDSSDGAGEVRFEAVQPGTYEVAIWCQRLTPRAKYDDVVVGAEPVAAEWLVDSGLVLRGVVVDDRGEPIARAAVSARNVGGDPRAARGGGWETAGRDGRFEVHGLKAGSVEVSASSEKHVEDVEPMKLEMTGDAEVTLKLSKGGTIEGRVVDEAGAPVDDAQVYARGDRWGGWARNRDDGTFTMEGLDPGTYRVQASRGWGESMRRPGTSDDDLQGERVRVAAGETTRVTLVVEGASGRITGRVVDAAGRPVTDAFIKAERESEAAGRQRGGGLREARWGWDEKPAVTDLDGRFTVERLAPGKYTVLAYRRGGSDAYAEGVAVGSDVVLTIKPTASLAGTIEAGGAELREIRVSIADHDTGVDRSEQYFMQGGAWVIRDLPAGKYDISASAPEGSAVIEDVVLAEGEHKTGIVLSLKKMVTITGRVVDGDSREPVAGMAVSAMPVDGAGGGYVFYFNSGGDQDNVSDASGRFTVDDVPQGKVRVHARPRDWGGSSPYTRGTRIVDLGDGDPIEIGDVPVLKRRTARGKRGGDFGFTLHELPPDTDPAAVVLKVASVRAGSPAAAAGLAADDVIVTVDGRDVRGELSWQYWPTASVPEGTTVSFGLERGVTLKIRAGRPE
jgi:protocatechuate 3,4-dioxygenase beta subunit